MTRARTATGAFGHSLPVFAIEGRPGITNITRNTAATANLPNGLAASTSPRVVRISTNNDVLLLFRDAADTTQAAANNGILLASGSEYFLVMPGQTISAAARGSNVILSVALCREQ